MDPSCSRGVGCRLAWLAGLLVLVSATPARTDDTRRGAVVVVEVVTDAAAEAGLQPGDVIREWSASHLSSSARRPIGSTFDFEEAEMEGARGPVTLYGTRGSRERSWTVRPGSWSWYLSGNDWGIETRPSMSAALLKTFEEGRALAGARNLQLAAGRYCLASAAAEGTDATLAAWFRVRAARALSGEKPTEAAGLYSEAARALSPRTRLLVLSEKGARAWFVSDLPGAEAAFQEARDAWQELDPDGLGVARAVTGLGVVARMRAAFAEMERCAWTSLEIRERLAPGSPAVAESLVYLSKARGHVSDLASAETFARRALAILERQSPGSHLHAMAHESLAYALMGRGDFAGAEASYRHVLELSETIRLPGSAPFVTPFGVVTSALNNLGAMAFEQGELAEAEDFHRRAMAAKERSAPNGASLGISLVNLAEVVRLRGRPDEAEALAQRALGIFEGTNGPTAAAYQEMGAGRLLRGDLAAAEELDRRALAIHARVTPGSLFEAGSRHELGIVCYEEGDFAEAEDQWSRALAIRERRAPGSTVVAETLHQLARTRRRVGDRAGAADLLCRAVEALESQRPKLGGSQGTRTAFAEKFADIYHDYVELLIELGRADDAFGILERSRARAFLSMLAERDLTLGDDVPPGLSAESRRIARESDEVLALLSKADDPTREALLSRLSRLRSDGDAVVARIRAGSPRAASLRYPRPLAAAEVRAALDPGTALLSYSVGRERTVLFVVPAGATSLTAIPIPFPREDLEKRVGRFRRLIRHARPDGAVETALVKEARDLFRDLLGPASPLLQDARRLLVCPDGPLHTLPFAALVVGTSAEPPRYLVEWKPVHTAVSATAYAELKRPGPRSEPRRLELVAFGDPRYPTRADAIASRDPVLRSALKKGLGFEPLPSTRREVEEITEPYGDRARRYLGDEATEERAKSIGNDVRYVHFACHAQIDEASPLSSALVLTIPPAGEAGRDNGLLQAWEILDGVRIDADLVTLSACETALGREAGGEGLVSLTRAFQYAGARSVLASLWKVADESTAELMKRFYRHLGQGLPTDESLRAAQRELLHDGGRFAHPFAWAGFQLAGDWK